jgi:hypothetical protein
VEVAPPQLSVALAAVYDIGARGGVTYGVAQVITGAVLSMSVSVCVQGAAVFPEQSATVQVALVVPGPLSVSSAGSHVPVSGPSQASVPDADGVSDALHKSPCSDVFTVEFGSQVTFVGFAVSSTVSIAVHVALLSASPLAVYVTTCELSPSHVKSYESRPSFVTTPHEANAVPSVSAPAPFTHSMDASAGQKVTTGTPPPPACGGTALLAYYGDGTPRAPRRLRVAGRGPHLPHPHSRIRERLSLPA